MHIGNQSFGDLLLRCVPTSLGAMFGLIDLNSRLRQLTHDGHQQDSALTGMSEIKRSFNDEFLGSSTGLSHSHSLDFQKYWVSTMSSSTSI